MFCKLNHIKLLAILIVAICFFSCKKYPENTLWFKKPEKTFKGGKITFFTKQGLDQMPYYTNLYKNFPYNQFGSSLDNIFNLSFSFSGNELKNELGKGTLKFSKTKREVEIIFTPKNEEYGAENIFISRLSWKVDKLTKDGQMKLSTDYKFNHYELQFN